MWNKDFFFQRHSKFSKKTTQGFRQMAKKETHSKLVYNKEFIIKTGIQSLGVFCSSDHITER